MKTNQAIGKIGEDAASHYLQQKGYHILERNFRIRGGEIDIIAKDQETIVFIEVKTRRSTVFGLPQEAITSFKLSFLKRAIAFYCSLHDLGSIGLRVDAIVVNLTTPHQIGKIEHIPNILS